MEKMEIKSGVIRGKAFWSHVGSTEVIQGKDTEKYSITLMPSEKDLKRIEKECREVWEEYAKENSKKKLTGEPNFSIREDNEGNKVLKFKKNSTIITKTGEKLDVAVPVFDGLMKKVPKAIKEKIGNGSEVIVSYQLFPFIYSSNNFGVSLRLAGLQVLKLVEYGADSPESMGFATVGDGYTCADNNGYDEDENIPFDTDDDENAADF